MLPSASGLQPVREFPSGRFLVISDRTRQRWFVLAVLAVLVAAIVSLQCATRTPHTGLTATPPHHALTAMVAHDHIGLAPAYLCAIPAGLTAQVSTLDVPRGWWTAGLVLVACVLFYAASAALTRAPPARTAPAAVVGGRALIYHLCVLRR
ncbi:hypothetical protein [Mycolicibacterium lutetiense]|uniref:Uncharacterized protein n=1 Tax=Mycolicibacterium lutetiense TaxID=1641992 RepID=A0ABS4ZS83_9MYCO|nr:hypothetical protein [Mycolicibacterium lutetiense]MBP2452354.1 hypothetical protein [Mycolicibacterium lutetiense]